MRFTLALVLGAILCPSAGAQEVRSLTGAVPDRIIYHSIRFALPPAGVFRYLADADSLSTWLTATARVELHVGGAYELFWDPARMDVNSTIGCRITALAPDQLLAFQWRSPLQFRALANGADPLTHVVISLVPEAGGTRLHLVHSGWRSGADWEAARQWQATAWEGALDQLRRRVGTLQTRHHNP